MESMKNNYIKSVQPSSSPDKFPEPLLPTAEKLSEELFRRGLKIQLGSTLKGGVISQVYEAKLNGRPVVVKHTEDTIPFDPTEFFISRVGHNTDTQVLKKLQGSKVNVPQVLYHFSDITTTIMEDVRLSGYQLMNDLLLAGKLPLRSAEAVAKSLADLSEVVREWEKFETNESAKQSIYERGLELRLTYPNTQKEYSFLEKEYTENNKFWVWPDGHPKNIFVNDKGEVLFIDFGRSHWGDQRYVLPNFLAHIIIYSLAGLYPVSEATAYIDKCVGVYKSLDEVDEELFCQYLAMEVLHRANGKWISGITKREQKIALANFGMTVFDDKVNKIEKLLALLR